MSVSRTQHLVLAGIKPDSISSPMLYHGALLFEGGRWPGPAVLARGGGMKRCHLSFLIPGADLGQFLRGEGVDLISVELFAVIYVFGHRGQSKLYRSRSDATERGV